MILVAPLFIGAATLGLNYLGQRQQQSAAQASSKKGKQLFLRDKRAMTALKPAHLRPSSEGASGSGVIPSALEGVYPGLHDDWSGLGMSFGYDPFGFAPAAGECPGPFSIRVMGRCVNLGSLPPGGKPAITGQVDTSLAAPVQGFGQPIAGWYGVGITPRVEVVDVSRCPPGFALGKDGICYQGLSRHKRRWDPGMKPLLTGGERAAIAKAARAARKLSTAKKSLARSAKALNKAC